MLLRRHLIAAGAVILLAGVVVIANPAETQAFTFGAAGDFANGTRYQETINAVGQNKVDFFLALGDTSYTAGTESS